jgi:hypothetical protein
MRISRRSAIATAVALVASLPVGTKPTRARVLSAGPNDYRHLLGRLRPGDELRLAPGTYREGLGLAGLHGTAENPIVISGPANRSALFLARPGHNTVELRDASYLELRDLTLDGRNIPGVDGVKSQAVTHHITLERLAILNHAAHQQMVGISTKAPAWAWIIRNNVIRGAGTGLYLGNSDGTAPFVHGLIEGNLITDTIGYGLQIKHQVARPEIPGMPTQPGSTIIRHNIVSKARQPQRGFQGSRPNLLVGHLPSYGPGLEDAYEIHGNLLYENLVGEPLFQGEGNVAFHDNLLINRHGDAVWIQPHNDRPRRITLHHNTVVARGRGVLVAGGLPGFQQIVARNAVFAEQPIEGGEQLDNLTADYGAASRYLRGPFGDWRTLDLRPRPGQLQRPFAETDRAQPYAPAQRDFAGNLRDGRHIGAYAGPDVAREGPLGFPPTL